MELIKIIAKLLNVSESKAQEFIDQEDEDGIIDLNKANLKKKFDEGHKKASKLSSKEIIDALKTELDIEIKGETPEEIAESLKAGIESRSADEISEDQIKASEAYKDLQAQLTRKDQEMNKQVEKKVKEVLKDKEKEYNEGIKKAKRESINSEVEAAAERWLTENKAILPEDPTKRRKAIKELVNKLSSDDIEKDEDGNYLISQNGAPVTNKDGHNAKLEDRFSEFDYLYSFQQVQQRSSSGLPPTGPGRPQQQQFQHFKGEVPKDEAGMNDLRNKKIYGELSKEAFKEAEAAYEAAKTA